MLSSIAEQYLAGTYAMDRVVLASLPHSSNHRADQAFILETLGQLWLAGIHPDWSALHAQEKRRRVPLPTYPFQRSLYWLERRVQWTERSQPAPSNGAAATGALPEEEAMQPVAETANGAGKHSRPDLGTPYVEPTNSVEQKVVEIWENLLGIHPVGIHDNFLRLGGNSLLAIRVAAELREAFQIELTVQAMMTTFTAAELALVVEEALVTMIEGMDETEVS
jgi:acyl carrier protein